jgi:hypothetical protein
MNHNPVTKRNLPVDIDSLELACCPRRDLATRERVDIREPSI